ncbi:hypothetical protein DET59_12927 [Rossellomorea aquimaris]|uniref:Uncharacterized protein n=1 Tax=Rossellomorea aquimaris TaxID=189382 RepID=A0A366EEV8_9BACI|nr:hypothetical protein DET59_12927 [Rossellomorea aquimaris]
MNRSCFLSVIGISTSVYPRTNQTDRRRNLCLQTLIGDGSDLTFAKMKKLYIRLAPPHQRYVFLISITSKSPSYRHLVSSSLVIE